MTSEQRERLAREWAISIEQIKLPSEMTAVQLESVAYEYGKVATRQDSHAYAVYLDGLRVGRRIQIERVR